MSDPLISLTRYKIRSQIGKGGMGNVYLAFDEELNREVAVKVINEKFGDNNLYWNRFKKEARAVSALNHPNILTIHDVGRIDGQLYLVTEFIQGHTLRHQISTHSTIISQTIEIAIQIADALAAAHEAGIIHRDIKPENVMIRADGYVKVLDFGLAKLVQDAQDSRFNSKVEPDASTAAIETDSSSIVGTLGYMSPEQLRGLKLDPRTDIWSLGVIIYEMIAGHSPFDSPTKSDQIAAILEHEPVPLTKFTKDVPSELGRIVERALAKDRELRYASAVELRNDLKHLKRELDFQDSAHSERTTRRASFDSKVLAAARSLSATQEEQPSAISRSGKRKMVVASLAGLCVLSTVGILYYLYGSFPDRIGSNDSSIESKMVNLTNTGKSVLGVISPDAKYVAQISEEGDAQALVIRSMTTGTSAVAVPSDNVKYLGLTFSNDSGYVYYVRYEKSDLGKLYKLTVIGANAIKLLEKIDSPITFSPDGNRFAFVRFDRERAEYSMVVANSDGTNEKVIAKKGSGERLSLGGPAWSPDGKRIVCAVASWSGGYHMTLFEVNLIDGTEQVVKCDPWFLVVQLAWQNDRNLIVNASTHPLSPLHIWRLSYPDGKLERITDDPSDYIGVSISHDSKTLITTQNNRQASIWVSGPDLAHENRIVTTVGPIYGLAWGADNRIFFSSMSGTNLDISAINTDGTDRRQLTFNAGDNYHPAVSSDGRFVVFSSSRAGGFNIWRTDARDGANAKQLTSGGGDFNPSVTPDSRFVIYEHQSGGSSTLWRVSMEGGDAIQVVDTYSAVPAISPDGRYVACRYYIAPDTKGVAVLPIEGGQPVKKFAIPIIDWQRVGWSRESNALSYVDSQGNDYNIWSQPLSDGPRKLLTNFKGEQIFSYDWSPDFRQLASQRGAEISDVFAIKLASQKNQ